MLIYPSIDNLLEKIDSKYSLVIMAAKRSHQLENEEDKNHRELLTEYKSSSNIGKSLEEISTGDLVIDPESVDSEDN